MPVAVGCAGGRTAGERIADMPHWMGGLSADAPPRRGTPEYDKMMRKSLGASDSERVSKGFELKVRYTRN
jgi:hypothetical protein